MELWIRSQDRRKLMPNPNLDIEIIDNEFYITHIINFDDSVYLGKYKTKERALEVLDEIQNILKPIFILDSSSIKLNKPYKENGMILMDASGNCNIEQLDTYVYEMPKE